MGGEYKLSELSALNHRRHRGVRLLIVVLVCSLTSLLVTVAWLVAASISGAAVGYVAVTTLFVCLLVSLGGYATRFWGTPPISLAVQERGLRFGFAGGRTHTVQWDEPSLDIELLDRSSDSKVPVAARYRVWVRGSAWDRRLPWRRVVPLTYVTSETLPAILESARAAGAHVVVKQAYNPVSLGSLTDSEAKAFLIQAGSTSEPVF